VFAQTKKKRAEEFMQSLACLSFQLQMTQRYLREKTFAPARVPPKAKNLDAL
jgi:hypothetical protein